MSGYGIKLPVSTGLPSSTSSLPAPTGEVSNYSDRINVGLNDNLFGNNNNYLQGFAESQASKGNDIMSMLDAYTKRNEWNSGKSWWQNTLEGRGNAIGMAGLGLNAYNAFSNAFDLDGTKALAKEQAKLGIAATRQLVDRNTSQQNIESTNANARNEAAQKFGRPSLTPSTTMMS